MPPTDNTEELYALGNYLINYPTPWPTPNEPFFFNMNYWQMATALFSHSEQLYYSFIQPNQPALICGFAACAIGHLPHAYPQTQIRFHCDLHGSNITYTAPDGIVYEDYDALHAYFKLPPEAISYLFSPLSYPEGKRIDPIYVGQRILAFLNGQIDPNSIYARYG